MYIFLLVIVSLIATYYYLISIYDYWKVRNIPGPPVKPFIGHIPNLWYHERNLVYDIADLYREYRNKFPFIGIFAIRQPQILVIDPKIVKIILKQKFQCFRDNFFSDTVTKHSDILFGRNPFLLKGNEWKERRFSLSPGFSTAKIKTQYPLIEDVCKKMTSYIEKKLKNQESVCLEAKDLCSRYTSSVVSNCIYGIDAESFVHEKPMILEIAQKIVANRWWYHLLLLSIFPRLVKFYKGYFLDKKVEQFFLELTKIASMQRESSSEKRYDYLDYILDLKNSKNLSDVDVAANGFTFFIDGYETSSIFMFHVLYELSKNHHVQSKLREEIEQISGFHHGELNFDAIEEITYLDQVVNETLRLHPPIPVIVKLCTEQVDLPISENQTVKIPEGTILNIPIYCIHRDETHYENPLIFDPERFSPETSGTKDHRENCLFMPFGDGPRICLGMRFANAQVKRGIVEIIKNFTLSLSNKFQEPFKMQKKALMFISTVENDILINFERHDKKCNK